MKLEINLKQPQPMTDTVIYTNKQSSAHYEIKENSNEV